MTKPRILDLFSGAGGAAYGYRLAGFEVVGVDNRPQPRFPFQFVQADALEYLATADLSQYAAIHASPPCQKYTVAQHAAKNAEAHPDLVDPVRQLLRATGKPYVIENVVGAPLQAPTLLCGLSFGLKVRRHRLFETNFFVMSKSCQCRNEDYFVIFGHEVRNRARRAPDGATAGRKNSIKEGRAAMGIDWMTRAELSEAIPPAMTEYIGWQLLAVLEARMRHD